MRRSHVELRSREITPPRQCLSDDHSHRREIKPKKPIREINAMTAKLFELSRGGDK